MINSLYIITFWQIQRDISHVWWFEWALGSEESAMFITFECSQCHGRIEIDGRGVGANVTCPHCKAVITVPQTGLGPGTTIGGFKIASKLGAGGMGEVYLARQLSMDRDVALKILPATLNLQKDMSARFLNEVKLLAKLEHPHIVTAYEAGADAGVLFLAMAYVEGESLEARLKREGPFNERVALTVTRKLAGALAYAWNRHQLLHRDIKPSNVLLDRDGEPKLVDFGLAKSLSADTALTMTNMMMGTPNYMSPEQAENSSLVDTRADMYSLGALLYNLVTGEVPFAGTSVIEVLKKQIMELLPDPRGYNSELNEGCVMLMEILLAKEREERHGSWEAVIADIDRVAEGKTPTRALPEMGASTLMRIRDVKGLAEVKGRGPRIKVKTGEKGQKLKNNARMKIWAWAGAAVAAGLVILMGVIIMFSGKDRPRPVSAQGTAPGTGAVMIGQSGTAPAVPKTAKIPETSAEKAANAALMKILKLAGVKTDLTQSRDLMRQIAARGYPDVDAIRIKKAVAAFEKTHGGTETAKSQWRLLDFLKQVGPEPRPPLLQATEENVKRAIEDWRIENNGSIGEVKSSVDKDGVTVSIVVQDCPAQTIRALGDLPLSSFKNSAGLKCQIRDIAPLADCPLRELSLIGCPVEDFSVLRKITTLQVLMLQGTQIKDLNDVQSLTNLQTFQVHSNPIKDLSPLKGMTKLNHLIVGPMAKDLSPVFECQLTWLGIIGCPIKDLNFITNFPALTGLQIQGTPLKDLSPLRGLQLNRVEMDNTPVQDLSPLKGMPLSTLFMANVPATNLNVLAGMPLKSVSLGHPDLVLDISPLAGMELHQISLEGRVSAFAPLKEATFSSPSEGSAQLQLSFDWIKVPDAAKLPEYIPALESLQIPYPGKAEAEIVLRFPNLKRVGIPGTTMTFDEFKQKFGQKGKEEKEVPKSAKPKPK